jgi:putative FmdB family regulatory protein
MPIYEYQPLTDSSCMYCSSGFDRLEKLSVVPLDFCPKCGQAVRRVISAHSVGKSGPSLNPSNLEKHGFTQYQKSSKGVYEKTAGKGPRVITDK